MRFEPPTGSTAATSPTPSTCPVTMWPSSGSPAFSGGSKRIVVAVPAALSRYIAAKGSVAVDGVSLTVNAVGAAQFEVNIIPHTQSVTVIGEYARGTAVNIEVDMLARYLERLVQRDAHSGVDLALLREHGYARDR